MGRTLLSHALDFEFSARILAVVNVGWRKKHDFTQKTNFKGVSQECPTHINQIQIQGSAHLRFSSSVIQNSVILIRLQGACHPDPCLEGTRC